MTITPLTIYSANMSAGALMLAESRVVANLMMQQLSETAWLQAITVDNLLQKPSPTTAKRQAGLIRQRLSQLTSEGLLLVATAERGLAMQMVFIATLLESRLLCDFVQDVYLVQRRKGDAIRPHDWDVFLSECTHRDAAVANWTESTRKKLFQVIMLMLSEADCLSDSRKRAFTSPYFYAQTKQYLHDHQHTGLMRLMMQLTGNAA